LTIQIATMPAKLHDIKPANCAECATLLSATPIALVAQSVALSIQNTCEWRRKNNTHAQHHHPNTETKLGKQSKHNS